MNITLSALHKNIINSYQKNFPLVAKPFEEIATQLLCNENDVITAIEELNSEDILSRLGPVFDHQKAGASTLAAIAVPEEQLDEIAEIVNQFEQVNHNYAREHHYNLWFVVTAKDYVALNHALANIEKLTGFEILVLPMEASYHIDLSFNINFDNDQTGKKTLPRVTHDVKKTNKSQILTFPTNDTKLSVIKKNLLRAKLEKGLPLVPLPYQQIATELSLEQSQVIAQIYFWQQEGLIKRFGLVVKHRKLGYIANAMVVWNIADKDVDMVAGQLSKRDEVSLCYRRPRRLPDWPYNLFCMIHGKSRHEVEQQIKDIKQELELSTVENDTLFSYKAYKQTGARYQAVDKNNHLKKES